MSLDIQSWQAALWIRFMNREAGEPNDKLIETCTWDFSDHLMTPAALQKTLWKCFSFNLLGYFLFHLWIFLDIEILDYNLSLYWQEDSSSCSPAWIIEDYWQGDFCGWPLKAFSFPVSSVFWLFTFKP